MQLKTIKPSTYTSINTSTYTVTKPHNDSTSDTFETFINTVSIPKTNCIHNFYFNSFTKTTSNFSISITVYPNINASTNFITNTSIKISILTISNICIDFIFDIFIDTTLPQTSNSTALPTSSPILLYTQSPMLQQTPSSTPLPKP